MGRASDMRLKRSRVRLSAVPPLSGINLGQVVHTHVASVSKQHDMVPVNGR